MIRLAAAATTVAFLSFTAAFAQEASSLSAAQLAPGDFSTQSSGPAIGFTLRGGVAAKPSYSGSDDVEVGPDLGAELNYLRLGGFTFGNPDPLFRPEGLGVTGSFRYVPGRDDDDDSELEGLDDVDASLELGAGLRYATDDYEVFGNVRYGVIGHEAWVGELGADLFARPTDRLTLRAGPRAFFGDDDYADTYYGVSSSESAASIAAARPDGSFAEYDPSGGLISTGVELGAGYRINENWGVDASLRYDRLRGDAADSPIVQRDEQVSASIGVTRRFTLGF